MDNKNKKRIYGKANYNDDVKKIVIIATVVIVVLGCVYFLTALVSGEISLNNKSKDKNVEVAIQYEEIIAGEILNRNKTEYYVLATNFSEDKNSLLLSLKEKYGYVNDSLYIYLIDLDKSFNNVLKVQENENIVELPTSINDLKIKETTLLKVNDGKVVERVTSYDSVKEELEKLSK